MQCHHGHGDGDQPPDPTHPEPPEDVQELLPSPRSRKGWATELFLENMPQP